MERKACELLPGLQHPVVQVCSAERLPEGLTLLEGAPFTNSCKRTYVDLPWPWPAVNFGRIEPKAEKRFNRQNTQSDECSLSMGSVAVCRPR